MTGEKPDVIGNKPVVVSLCPPEFHKEWPKIEPGPSTNGLNVKKTDLTL
jgi:hypothetical protein